MIKQCKGKSLDKVPTSKLFKDDEMVYASVKLDGNYCQVHKEGDNIKFYTSGGKQFYIDAVAEKLKKYPNDIILEGEFLGTGNGKFGDRTLASTGHYKSNFEKGLPSPYAEIRFFDVIYTDIVFEDRLTTLNVIAGYGVHIVPHRLLTFAQAKKWAKEVCNEGWEGIMVNSRDHRYLPGKRVNTAIKIKIRPTADLKCVGVAKGKGKYYGLIGSLILFDENGKQVNVGSGLSDADRQRPSEDFIGKIIEIEYEKIIDTYIQPTFVRIRDDKA